jgi:hypothetical protein
LVQLPKWLLDLEERFTDCTITTSTTLLNTQFGNGQDLNKEGNHIMLN